MNAPNPLAALLGALPITVNLTINGDVHIGDLVEGETIVEQVEENPCVGIAKELIGPLSAAEVNVTSAPRRPSVGRIVHYLPTDSQRVHHGSKGNAPWAAIITGVLEVGDFENGIDIVSLMVFPPNRKPFLPDNNIPEGGPKEKGAWSWPPKA